MSWSPQMRESRRSRGGQADMFDSPVLSFKLVCDGNDPLTNAFVKTRKAHICCICTGPIGAGIRVRRETRRSADGRKIETSHVCQLCADAIAYDVANGDYSPAAVASGTYWVRTDARYRLARVARA
ncbi:MULTISPECIES: hypothetical protein [unclassified Mesorhizobium]|uniref:hypothetical protein n=1 Tax=unclassified Mesorhizobium TaxID=325217 RepID=UPI00112A32B3|nr:MULTISPECIES: hypothetical protein [unclassified Mesorhizobium]TPM06785.1 hypothetical protein FJ939_12025 [Mesorhizobium sp. B2-3-8]TPM15332.1 hypothetical protein FJ940_14080 [Mesorhizobium sp. B2-3-7]